MPARRVLGCMLVGIPLFRLKTAARCGLVSQIRVVDVMLSCPVVSSELKCDACAMRRQGICGRLTEATQARLARIATLQTISANSRVWGGDCNLDLVGVLVSGYFRTLCHGVDGHRQIFSLALPGDIVTESRGQLRPYEVEASTSAQLCRFELHGFRRLLEEAPDLARAVYALRVAKLDQLRLLTWSLGALTLDERICAFLALATRYMPYSRLATGGGVLTMALARADIADLLGTTRETISRITHRLDAIGAIRILSPYQFEIPDLSLLVRMGCIEDCFDTIPFAAANPAGAQAPGQAGNAAQARTVAGQHEPSTTGPGSAARNPVPDQV
ncbi:MAG: Crp/Fnr family transcriptional regulator [Paracoccaceae bacterium]|nr:Crp/Fnr family transcriptional regulator [Paracoccaceae bacterium]